MNERYRLIITGDGTYTLLDTVLNETMHTMSGAYEESLIKHVKASRILEGNSQSLRILDIGFGLGYNILAALTSLNDKSPDCNIEVISMESDNTFSKWIELLSFEDERRMMYEKVKTAYKTGIFADEKVTIRVEFGDARSYVNSLVEKGEQFDAVFQDAYSPGKNPELWTYDFFQLISSLMKSSAVLTTYSAAPQIRRALIEAGFKVGRADSTGMKKEGTVASLNGVRNELTVDEVHELLNNIKSTVYRDESLNDSREVILDRRIKEMERIRENRRAHRE